MDYDVFFVKSEFIDVLLHLSLYKGLEKCFIFIHILKDEFLILMHFLFDDESIS